MDEQTQNHPLYSSDRKNIDDLLAKDTPSDNDLVDLARLLKRYENFPGANDLRIDMSRILGLWELTKEQLNLRTREIWSNGFRPGNEPQETVGSGFDTAESSEA